MSAINTHPFENSRERWQLPQNCQAELLPDATCEIPSLASVQRFISVLTTARGVPRSTRTDERQPFAVEDVRRLQAILDDQPQPTWLAAAVVNVALERVSLRERIEEIVIRSEENSGRKEVGLFLEVPADLPAVLASPLLLRQALVILVGNAVKFTGAGGSVTISVHHREHSAKFLCVQVSDTGCGMTTEQLGEVFEQANLASMRDGGNGQRRGMNLPLCKELVNCQGGLIWANSEPGRGSAFSFTLPVAL